MRLTKAFRYVVAVGCLVLNGCNNDDPTKHAGNAQKAISEVEGKKYEGNGPVQIACTTGQIADALRQIGGEHVNVTGLMGPSVDPHLYQATLADINTLKGADIIFYNGMHLEGRLGSTLTQMGERRPTFAVTARLQAANDQRLRKPADFEGHYDPHVWHNVELWSDCVRFITDQLAAFDESHADDYRSNAAAYLEELAALHQEVIKDMATIPVDSRVLVTAHDAFGYFGEAYGIEVFGLKGVSTEDEVSIQRSEQLVKLLVDRKVPAVFVESAVAPRVVEALIEPCKSAGHTVVIGGELYADALGPPGSGGETYVGMIRQNVATIVQALKPSAAE